MASFRPQRAETAEDRRRYTRDLLTEVACLDCLARVGVQKNSEHHTSIQWTPEAAAQCPELARRGPRELHRGCARLGASIEGAIRAGALVVGVGDVL